MASPSSPFLWERDALVEQYGNRRFVYGRWDRRFGCWHSGHGAARPAPFLPPWKLVDASGRLVLSRDRGLVDGVVDDDDWFESATRYTDPVEFETLLTGGYAIMDSATPEIANAAVDLFHRYVELIPFEVRRLAGAFKSWQWTIFAMVWERPAFADFLARELENVGPGFVGAALVLNDAGNLVAAERTRLCHRIMFDPRTDILGERLPKPALAALTRIDLDSMSVPACRALLKLMRDLEKAKLVARLPRLTERMIVLLDRLPGWLCAGNLVPMVAATEDLGVDAALVGLARRVECDAPHLQAAIADGLHKVRNPERLHEAVRTWTRRLAESLDFPTPPVPANGPLRPLSSAKMLRAEGLRMHNCIADYISRVVDGKNYFYCWDAAERACVCLERDAGDRWRLGQVLGVANRKVTARTRAQIAAALKPPRKPRVARADPRQYRFKGF